MTPPTNLELLREFARHRTEAAFAELVRRHIDLVHSAARRLTARTDHLQPCCFGLSFGYIIRGLPHFGKPVPPVAVQRTFNARLLKNPLKVRGLYHRLSEAYRRNPCRAATRFKSKGLHVALNPIFTAAHQRQVRSDEYGQALTETFRGRIGAVDFSKVVEFGVWLAGRPKRRDICCYLLDHLEQRTESGASPNIGSPSAPPASAS
jgi:hypothetical protein